MDKSTISQVMSFLGKLPRPGRKVLKPCPLCGQHFGVRELRAHKPHCAKPVEK